MEPILQEIKVIKWKCSACSKLHGTKDLAKNCCDNRCEYREDFHTTEGDDVVVEFNHESVSALLKSRYPIHLCANDDGAGMSIQDAKNIASALNNIVDEYNKIKKKEEE